MLRCRSIKKGIIRLKCSTIRCVMFDPIHGLCKQNIKYQGRSLNWEIVVVDVFNLLIDPKLTVPEKCCKNPRILRAGLVVCTVYRYSRCSCGQTPSKNMAGNTECCLQTIFATENSLVVVIFAKFAWQSRPACAFSSLLLVLNNSKQNTGNDFSA